MCISRHHHDTAKPNGLAKASQTQPVTHLCNTSKFIRFALLFVPLFCFAPSVKSTTAWEYLDDLENFVPELGRSLMYGDRERHLYSGDEHVLEEMARRCTALSQLVIILTELTA